MPREKEYESPAEKQRAYRERKKGAKTDQEDATDRAAAIEHGRRLGEAEALSRRESALDTDLRIRRAQAYAAWEYDGCPVDQGAAYRKEFGLPDPKVMPSLERPQQEVRG